jgi:aminomethyltransferase
MGIRRIEAGILDYGTDMNRSNNPFEMGLGRLVDFKKTNYIGKESLQGMNKNVMMYGIKCEETVPFSGLNVLEKDEIVGTTTVGAFSPLLKSGIGFVLFKNTFDGLGKKLSLQDQDKNLYDCEISALPFYDQSKKIPRGHN